MYIWQGCSLYDSEPVLVLGAVIESIGCCRLVDWSMFPVLNTLGGVS